MLKDKKILLTHLFVPVNERLVHSYQLIVYGFILPFMKRFLT